MFDPENFKSTYKILLEISKVWKDLTDAQQAVLLEKIAGKHRASTVAALLNDQETLVKAYEDALNSTGSAMEEFNKRTESIQFHLNQLKNAWQVFASNSTTVGTVNGVIDALTRLLDFFDKIGGAFAVLRTVGTALAVGVLTKLTTSSIEFGRTLLANSDNVQVFGRTITSTTRNANLLAGGLTRLRTVVTGLSVGIGAVAAGVVAMIAVTSVVKWYKDYVNKVENLTEAIQGLESELDNLQSQYDSLNDKTYKTDGEEKKIKLLEKQIELKEKQIDLEKQEKAQAVLDSANNYFPRKKALSEVNSLGDFVSNINNYIVIKDKFYKSMDKAEISVKKYTETLKLIEDYNPMIEEQENKLVNLSKGTNKYSSTFSTLLNLQNGQRKALEKSNKQQNTAVAALSDLYKAQEDLNWVIENGTASQKAEAEVRLNDLNIKLNDWQITLGLVDSYDSLVDKVSDLAVEVSTMGSILEQANKTKAITNQQMDQLKKNYPELAKKIEDYCTQTEAGYKLEEEALKVLQNTFNETSRTHLQAQYDMTNAAIVESQKRIQQYSEEVSALLSLYKAITSTSMEMSGSLLSGNPLYNSKPSSKFKDNQNESIVSTTFGKTGNALFDTAFQQASKNEQIAYKKILNEQKLIERKTKELEELEKQLNSSNNTPEPSTAKAGGNGAVQDATKNDKEKKDKEEKIDLYDKYANAIDKVNEKLESYDAAIEKTRSQLELNQSYEERNDDLINEELALYDQLIEQTEVKRKAQNDALWEENYQIEQLTNSLKTLTGIDMSGFDNADLDKWAGLNLTGKFADSEDGQRIQQIIDAVKTLRSESKNLNIDLISTKREIHDLTSERYEVKISYHDEILEKLRGTRSEAETLLNIFEDVGGTEERRLEITKNLISSYKEENDVLYNLMADSLNELNKLDKNSVEYQQQSVKYQQQYKEYSQTVLENLRSVYDLRKKELEIQKEQAEKEAEISYYGSEGKDAWEDRRKDEIDKLQSELDALNENDDEENYLEQVKEKEEEIAKLQEKIDNLRNQETIQQLKQLDDGSFQWEYIEDQKSINDALDDLESTKEELQKLHDDKQLDDQKKAIQDKIDAIEDEVDERQKQYDRELKLIQDTYDSEVRTLDNWLQSEVDNHNKRIAEQKKFYANLKSQSENGITAVNKAVDLALGGLYDTFTGNLGNIYTKSTELTEKIIGNIRNMLEAIEEANNAKFDVDEGHGYATGLKFVEKNNMPARLHYGERVLTASEARQYNKIEPELKSGKIQEFFNSMQNDTLYSLGNAVRKGISTIQSPMPSTTNNSSMQLVIENVSLPNVEKPMDFLKVINNWAKDEFGGLAQKAKIRRAK